MFASHVIVHALRRELKADGVSYVELAKRLQVSHASVKRWLTTGNFSLVQLDALLKATGIEWSRIASAGATERNLLDTLTWEQEAQLVEAPRTLLVAMAAMNHLSIADITSIYTLTEAESVQHLMALDRMGLLELMPNNRVKMRLARTFGWITNGPIQRYFRTVVGDFFDGDFTGVYEAMSFTTGMLTAASAAQVSQQVRKMGEELARLHHRDANAPFAEKGLMTILVAARPWEAAFMRELRRPDSTSDSATLVKGGKRPRH